MNGRYMTSLGLGLLTLLCATVVAAQETKIGSGRFELFNSSGNTAILLDGASSSPRLRLGFGGTFGSAADVDLLVEDPSSGDFGSLVGPVFMIDASLGALSLGSGGSNLPGEDGEIYVEDGHGNTTFQVAGDSGTASQVVSGNGLVKAWAKINADGTVHSCWNCNPDPLETRLCCDGLAHYEVDFLLGDISTRPYLLVTGPHTAVLDSPFGPFSQQVVPIVIAAVTPRFGDTSSLYVQLADLNNTNLRHLEDFTVFVF